MEGLDPSLSRGGLCGRGTYFTNDSVKSDQYAFKRPGGKEFQGCRRHDDYYCSKCDRYVILCTVNLGQCQEIFERMPKQYDPQGVNR